MENRELQRWASVSAGALLALAGLKKGGRNGIVLSAVGSVLAAIAFTRLAPREDAPFARPGKTRWQMPRERLVEDARVFGHSSTAKQDVVNEASEESFPASDATSHTPTTAVGKHE